MNLNDLIRANELGGIALAGLGLISKLTKSGTDDMAVEILSGIRGVLGVIADGAEGKVTPEACRDKLAALHDKIAANDSAADARLSARFPDK